jgi:hypothetical protein
MISEIQDTLLTALWDSTTAVLKMICAPEMTQAEWGLINLTGSQNCQSGFILERIRIIPWTTVPAERTNHTHNGATIASSPPTALVASIVEFIASWFVFSEGCACCLYYFLAMNLKSHAPPVPEAWRQKQWCKGYLLYQSDIVHIPAQKYLLTKDWSTKKSYM